MPARLRPALALLLAFAAGVAQAATVSRVEIRGLDEEMGENVRHNLSLEDAIGREVSARRLEYLLDVADDEAREALEPFGHYSPVIRVTRAGAEGALVVTVDVQPGEPVRVRERSVVIEGDGSDDRYLREEVEAFRPEVGAVLDHRVYEAGRTRITRRLAERGYFDADFLARRVEVTRAEHAADIDLRWDSGERYDMGEIHFEQTPAPVVHDRLLQRLVYWEQGEYYHQGRLDRLRRSLVGLDYFRSIDIVPRIDEAEHYEVPVDVTLVPARRDVYTAGASYGTESGPGVLLGLERRYVNMRGHKALAQLDWARFRKTATIQYRIPAFAWLDGWYTGSLQFADEQTDYIDTRRLELVASRSGQYNTQLNLVASVHALRERWAYATDVQGLEPGDPVPDPDALDIRYRYANYLYPSLRAEYIDVDNRLDPRRGIGGSLTLRGGLDSVGSDASFAQVHARASWYRGFGQTGRLIVRGELGRTFTDEVIDLAPSLRFYAGGDRSIRGYQWREVGPRIEDDSGRGAFALGAENVVTASVEYEHYFGGGPWGVAAFVDSGSAFNGRDPDWHTGVGLGARWRSPVGPVRLDIGRGLDNPDSSFTIHLNLGAEF
ncbi:MAG: autotransporter assembly complex family protein [Pseudoxanthomonas suwonensis]|nr:autotransporter assembly complex family protein [Pseudoxanthomonas suwonensis]